MEAVKYPFQELTAEIFLLPMQAPVLLYEVLFDFGWCAESIQSQQILYTKEMSYFQNLSSK